jgi:hypothetical protein
MFKSLSRSWEFTKLSYGLLREHKHLTLFPVLSTTATFLVLASFILPLWQLGLFEEWSAAMDSTSETPQDASMYVTAFLFYFCNYFVIVFFNTALCASVMRIMEQGSASVGFGLSFATKRIHSIFGWALISAIIGMLLKAIERNKKGGQLIAAVIGSAWTAMTYFVVPVIATDGVGPIEAFKRSMRTLKSTWGTALMGNFSMGTIAFLIMLPVFAVGGLLFWLAFSQNSDALLVIAIMSTVLMVIVAIAATSTADGIFKAYLYSYATGRSLPADVDRHAFEDAFRQKDSNSHQSV